MDTMAPIIPKADKTDIKTEFKYPTLKVIKRKSIYKKLNEAKRQLARNALALTFSFRGGAEVGRGKGQT